MERPPENSPMLLSDVSIKRPVFTLMMSMCLMVLGGMGISRLGTDLFPDVALPVAVVSTVYRGAGPAEIETQVVQPIEDAVAGISGVDKIHSWSRENVGLVVIQFKLSVNLDRAVQEVRDKVAALSNVLPADADLPTVSRLDISATPVLTYAASADLSTREIRRLIEDRIKPALAQLEGVADVRVTGGDVREIQVEISLDKAKAAGLAPAQIAQQIGMENLDIPAGRLDLGPSEMTVRSLGQFRDVEELRALPVGRGRDGTQIRLDEVATVIDGVAERRTAARLNGADAVILEIIKQPGSNTLTVAEQVKEALAKLEPSMGHGFETSLILDQSVLIDENAKEVWIALVWGGLMAILIILFFLLDLRGTLISALALPTSVVGTFFVMYVLDYTLNQMTLLGLALAIGLLIDDAVVVREAITHRLEQGEEPEVAASKGTSDVGLAVLATTLSLVAVFIPVAFMPGIVGQFFKQFGITISAAVLISLFISFTLDPMLSARFAKRRIPGEERRENVIARTLRAGFEATERGYGRLLAWVLDHKMVTMLLTLAILGGSAWGARNLGIEFLSPEDRGQFLVDLQLPDQSSLALTTKRADESEALLRQIPEVEDVYAILGPNGEVNKAKLRVLIGDKNHRNRSVFEIKEEARRLLQSGLEATRITLADPPVIEGVGDMYPIMVRVTGPDLDQVMREAEFIEGTLKAIPGTADVRIDASPPKPELQLRIDRTRAADLGLSAASIGGQLRMALNGEVVAKLREGKEETEIRVRLAAEDRASPDRLRQLDLFTAGGVRPVADVTTIEIGEGPAVIEHENRERQIAVYAQLDGVALGDVAAQLKAAVDAHELPPGYAVIYDGMMKQMEEQNVAFAMAFGLAFVFIYMVLASQFESLKHPFTIMVSLPLALIGAVLGLVFTGHHLSLGAMIGVILLMGLVTKNAILLVDGALQRLRDGDDVITALLTAGPRRLRPILMTSFAMGIAMIPTAVGTGVGSEFRAPMAIAVIGGVITSTFLTLLVVPVVFYGFERFSLAALLRRSRDAASTSAPPPGIEPGL